MAGRFKFQSLLSVVAWEPVDPGKLLQLTSLDAAAARYAIRAVVYYRSNPFVDGPMLTKMENLRMSLSNVLSMYPKITGRLARESGESNRWVVKCNDAGVRLSLVDIDASLDEWLVSATTEEEEELTAWETMPEDTQFWPPFRVQMNSFKCGGIALGLSCSHMLADVTSLALFINSWAQIHNGQSPSHLPIHFNLPPPPLPAISPVKIKSNPPPTSAAKMSTAAITISGNMIEQRLSQIRRQSPDATPFDFLSSIFWSRIIRLQEPHPARKKRSLSILLDRRNQWIHRGYFGNAWLVSVLEVDADILFCSGAEQVTDLVNKHVKGVKEDEFWSVMTWMEVQNKKGEEGYGVYESQLTCINLENVIEDSSMYLAVFKGGDRPVHVSCSIWGVKGGGLIMVGPSPEKGGRGRTVTVTLPEEQMDKLCKDEAVLDLEPTMVLTPKR